MADQMTAPGGAAPAAQSEPDAAPRPNIVSVFLTYVGEVALLLGQTGRELVKGRIDARDLLDQMAFLGVNSLPIALLTCFASGAVLALYFAPFLHRYGAESLTGGVVALAISRELAPVLTGVMVAARAGSAIAAELGTMQVSEQIDALRALAVSPVRYLVVPRVLAAVLMLPFVCALADAAGIGGGYLVAVYMQGVPAATYPNAIRQFLIPSDFIFGLIKTLAFGLIIALVGCQQGLATRGGATEVGRATTNAVVIAIVLIYLSNFFLAYALFNGGTV